MADADDFWMLLARTADSYDDGGVTPGERAARALRRFREMPAVAKREMLQVLRSMSYNLADLYTVAAAEAGVARRIGPSPKRAAAG